MYRSIAALVAAFFLALPMVIAGHPVDAAGGKSHVERKADRDRSVREARDHIDRNDRLTNEQKARLHAHADAIEGEFAAIDKATEQVLALTAGGASATPEEKAKIEAEVREHLVRIGSSHAKLGALQRELTADVQASPDLSPEEKAKVTEVLKKVAEGKMSLEEARASLVGTSGNFVLMVVLFVLLIIIGAG